MIITEIEQYLEVIDVIEPGLTYKLNAETIRGNIDELESLRQAIYKVLATERYEYPIYSFDYGIDIASLIGQDAVYVEIELKRRIKECLLEDSRIKDVSNFVMSRTGDELHCTFDVVSIYGELEISKVVIV